MRRTGFVLFVAATLFACAAWAQPAVDKELAPTGKFRIGINGNNSALMIRHADGTIGGLCAELGKFIASKLGVPYEPLVYESAAPFTASFAKREWDIIITGRNATVEKLLDVSGELFSVEYVYVAAPGRAYATPADVDAPGVTIAVPRNASADVFLSRNLKSAQLLRVDGPLDAAVGLLRAGKADLYASSINSGQALEKRLPGAKIVGTFHLVPFNVTTQKGLSPAAHARLIQLINEAKVSGLVRKSLEEAGAQGVRYAP